MKVAVVAIVAVVLAMLIFLGGMWIGSRSNDSLSNLEVSAKVEQESSGLHRRLDSVDAKLDILLNIATNGVGRDFRR